MRAIPINQPGRGKAVWLSHWQLEAASCSSERVRQVSRGMSRSTTYAGTVRPACCHKAEYLLVISFPHLPNLIAEANCITLWYAMHIWEWIFQYKSHSVTKSSVTWPFSGQPAKRLAFLELCDVDDIWSLVVSSEKTDVLLLLLTTFPPPHLRRSHFCLKLGPDEKDKFAWELS